MDRIPGVFGPGIIGKEAAAQEAELQDVTGMSQYGPGVVGPTPPAAPVEPAKVLSVSVPDMDAALANNPVLLDDFLKSEFERSSGPRKSALDVLKRYEEIREGGPRQDVLDRLAAAR